MPSTVSFRRSIRWFPDVASEPTDTVVLTGGKTGVFIDVRFIRSTKTVLDWAFAGYRSTVDGNRTKFEHLIDSRTENPSEVQDYGSNSELPNGMTLEKGEMVNPATGKMTAYEEIWEDESPNEMEANCLFMKNVRGTAWYARVGSWQQAVGRDSNNEFWAWQAHHRVEHDEWSVWSVKHCTGDKRNVRLLPEGMSEGKSEGQTILWGDDEWIILETD